MAILKRFVKESRGQSLVEFALVIPMLLAVVLIIFDFGWIFFNYAVVSNASRHGARLAVVGEANVETSIAEAAKPLSLNDISINSGDQEVEVIVSKVVDPLVLQPAYNLLKMYTGEEKTAEGITVQGRTVMRLE